MPPQGKDPAGVKVIYLNGFDFVCGKRKTGDSSSPPQSIFKVKQKVPGGKETKD